MWVHGMKVNCITLGGLMDM